MEGLIEILEELESGIISVDHAESKVLRLFNDMHQSLQGTNGYLIEHLINDTYQVVSKIDGSVYYQGTKRDCDFYLNGTD